MQVEQQFMQIALNLAKKTNPTPNPRVGAVLVKNNVVIGQGFHKAPGMPHAEIEAINDAIEKAGGDKEVVKGSTLYVTLEPCSHKDKRTPPCTNAILEYGIAKVVCAMKDPNPKVNGIKELRDNDVKVVCGILEEQAKQLNRAYNKHVKTGVPFVAIKMGTSIDGKTAAATGQSKWITGKESREAVQQLRSEFDSILVGANTVINDNPKLTCRIKESKNPYRIIIDGRLRIPLNAQLFRDDDKTIIATTKNAPKQKIQKMKKVANVLVFNEKKIDPKKLIKEVGKLGITSILVEGGSETNASLLEADVVDKLYLFIAPKIIGGQDAKGVFGGKGISSLEKARKIKNIKIKKIGNDLLLECDL